MEYVSVYFIGGQEKNVYHVCAIIELSLSLLPVSGERAHLVVNNNCCLFLKLTFIVNGLSKGLNMDSAQKLIAGASQEGDILDMNDLE